MNVLIVDDEPIQRRIIKKYCETLGFANEISEARDGVEALRLLNEKEIDVLLCDIEMPLLNGINLVSSMLRKPQVIFITAYPNFAVNAFDLDVVDYLLKPVLFERFVKAIQKLKTKQIVTEKTIVEEPFLILKVGNTTHKIEPNKVTYLEAQGNFTFIHFLDGSQIEIYIPFNQLLSRFSPQLFFQIHRSFAVNKNHVTARDASNATVNGKPIPVGRSFKKEADRLL